MNTITQEELVSLLNGIKGATFGTIVAETDARLLKTGNPFGPVRKRSRVNVCLGFQYEAAVNRQREREELVGETFEAAPRQWGERVTPMLIQHKDRLYIETKVERAIEHAYQTATGEPLTDEDVAPFLPVRSKSTRQETAKEIMVRDYSLDSIRYIKIGGNEYEVR